MHTVVTRARGWTWCWICGWSITITQVGLFTITAGAVDFTRTLSLDPGWSAIWLDVAPQYDSGEFTGFPKLVEEVFTNANVTTVAQPVTPAGTSEFITEPSEQSFNQPGWRIWHRVSEFAENSLATVSGNSGYLVFVAGTNSIALDITGAAEFFEPTWLGDSYNLVGFNLTAPVPFADFFAAADGTHPVQRIFRLDVDGTWTSVHGSDLMLPNEAYWVFSDGPSDFAGPVKFQLPFNRSGVIDFGVGPATIEVPDPEGVSTNDTIFVQLNELTMSNVDEVSHTLRMTKMEPSTSAGASFNDRLRIYEIIPDPSDLDYDIGRCGQVGACLIGDLGAGESRTMTLGVHRNWSGGGRIEINLYRLEVDNLYFWLPIRAENPTASNAESAADPVYQGLWVGDILLDEVTSLAEDGSSLRETPAPAPMRILLHVDTNGAASLLEHVTIMREQTADSELDAKVVLVLDDAQIPFYAGIEERNGTLVGGRVETAAFDMPRLFDAQTQTALVDDVAFAFGLTNTTDVTQSNIVLYVNSRDSRPPALVEAYHTTWPLTGGLGANRQLGTVEPFEDVNGNSLRDEAEPFTDTNTNGMWDAAEPFTDTDGNETWSDGEPLVDVNSNNVWDAAEPFEDIATDNGTWDPAEAFTDLNGNGLQDDSPLLLDPFHRSNPFRHAFHPRHGAGKAMTRSLTITFDETQEVGYLRGTYKEVVTGLAAVPLVMSGNITLQQINDVGELQ